MTPWLQADVDAVARAPETDAFENSPFLALHVRRGDKIELHEAQLHLCEVGVRVRNNAHIIGVHTPVTTYPHAARCRLEQV